MKRLISVLMTIIMTLSLVCMYDISAAAADTLDASEIITGMWFGKEVVREDNTATVTDFTEGTKRDESGVLLFEYTVPKEGIAQGSSYSMDITGKVLPAGSGESFTVTVPVKGVEKQVASGTVAQKSDGTGMTLTINFVSDEEVIGAFTTGIKGYFYVSAQFNKSQIENNGSQEISLTASGVPEWRRIVPFAVDEVKPALSISKNDGEVDNAKKTVTWTIVATVKATDLPSDTEDDHQKTTITITDKLPEGLTYDTYTFDGVDTTGGSSYTKTGYTDSVSHETGTDGIDTVTLTASGIKLTGTNQTVKFTIVTKYTDEAVESNLSNGTCTWYNRATGSATYPTYTKDTATGAAKYVEPSTITAKSDQAKASIAVAEMTKVSDGKVDTATGCVKWTITVSSAYDGQYVKDKLNSGHLYVIDESHPVTISVNGVETKTITSWTSATDNSSTYSNTYAAIGSNEANQATFYLGSSIVKKTITYYTKIDSSYTEGNISNEARFYAGGIDPGIWKTASFNPGTSFITKRAGDYEPSSQTIPWTITVGNTGYLSNDGLVFTDTFSTTVDQSLYTADGRELQVAVTDNNVDTTYTLQADGGITHDGSIVGTYTKTVNEDDKETGFTIAFNKDVLPSSFTNIKVTYTTRLSDKDISTGIRKWINKSNINVSNKISVKSKDTPSLSVDTSPKVSTPVLSKTNVGGYNYTGHKTSWKLTVNASKMALDNPTVVDTLSSYTFSAADWKYDTTSLKVTKETTDASVDLTQGEQAGNYSVVYGTDAKTGFPNMTIVLPSTTEGEAYYTIEYDTVLTDTGKEAIATNDDLVIKNTSKLTGDPIKEGAGVVETAQTTVTNHALVKTGTQSKDFISDHILVWTVQLNKNLATISEAGKNTVVVTDQLADGLTYVEDTTTITPIEVASDGSTSKLTALTLKTSGAPEEGKPVVSYDEETNVYTITFAASDVDGKAYEISFGTRALELNTEYSNGITVGKLSVGINGDKGSASASSHYNGGFTTVPGTGTLAVIKKDSNDNLLPGAEFTLYKQKKDETYYKVTSFTTGTSEQATIDNEKVTAGKILTGLSYGTYKIVETAAPDGYIADDTEKVFTLSASSSSYIYELINYKNDEDLTAEGTFSKQDAAGGEELPGATITLAYHSDTDDTLEWVEAAYASEAAEGEPEITRSDDNMTLSWVSGDVPVVLSSLPEGEYTFTETTAPKGYAKAETIGFKVSKKQIYEKTGEDASGRNVYSSEPVTGITMADEELDPVRISKVAVNDGSTEELEGASLGLYEGKTESGQPTGELVDEWVSDGSIHEIEASKLKAGTWYTLCEEAAPDGYEIATNISFRIADDGSVADVSTNAYKTTDTDERLIVMEDAVEKIEEPSTESTESPTESTTAAPTESTTAASTESTSEITTAAGAAAQAEQGTTAASTEAAGQPKTGDNTPIAVAAIIMLAALGGAGVVVYRKKRR